MLWTMVTPANNWSASTGAMPSGMLKWVDADVSVRPGIVEPIAKSKAPADCPDVPLIQTSVLLMNSTEASNAFTTWNQLSVAFPNH